MDGSKPLIADDEARKGSSRCLMALYGQTDRISHRLHRITLPRTADDVERRLSTLLLYGKARGKGEREGGPSGEKESRVGRDLDSLTVLEDG